jgi:hypothetical protein
MWRIILFIIVVPYQLTFRECPTYLHAKGEGDRTPENVMRYFKEVHEACVAYGVRDVLLEMSFTGPSLDTVSIFRIISQRSPEAVVFRRIAYVDRTEKLDKARFAETIAVNRNVNVRLFPDIEEAERWLSSLDEKAARAS